MAALENEHAGDIKASESFFLCMNSAPPYSLKQQIRAIAENHIHPAD